MSLAASTELDPLEQLRQLKTEATNREVDEIVDGRTQIAHYYTGVADGLEVALNVLEDPGGGPP